MSGPKKETREGLIIRAATPTDGGALAAIYNHYVTQTIVTFEEEPVTPGEMARRIEGVTAASLPWLVAQLNGQVVGYAYASTWHGGRRGYRFTTEITVYLHHEHPRRGIGSRLYEELFSDLRGRGIHSVIGGIALPNPASVALHEKFGMEKVAHFKAVGTKFDRWIAVGYWQRVL